MIDPAKFPAADSAAGPFPLRDAVNRPLNGGGVAIAFSGQVWGVSEKGCPSGAGTGCATRLHRRHPPPLALPAPVDGQSAPFYDVNGDEHLTRADVLMVIKHINAR